VLTAELVRPRLRVRGTEVSIDMLDAGDAYWLQSAAELIALWQRQAGQSQAAWNRAVESYEGERVDYVVVRGLAKVLSDAATFLPLTTPLAPVELRERLFARGPAFATPQLFHPQARYEVVQSVADELGISAEQVEATLFADRPATYLLTDMGPAWTAQELLVRYNLELARGVLYWASQVQIEVHSNYKDLWKYLKLFKLMYWAEPQPDGYRIDLDGPISPFVRATTRYGRQFAAFLPALLLCDQWRMVAAVRSPQSGTMASYRLDHTSALQSHFKQSGLFDSRLEADFASEFEQKMGGKRGHWRLTRESEVLLLEDTVMIPDFILVDEQDEKRKIMIELVGFWHPQYLRRKVEKVRAANCAHLLLLVYKGLNVTEEAFQDTASEVIFFQHKPVLKEVMETVEAMAQRVYGPRQKRERTPKKRRKAKRPGGSDEINEGEQPEEQGGQSTDNFERVKLFLAEHPGAKVREVAQALAISRTTANKWMTRLREAQ
jgi:predicted nuclease of restriction endonuclease-like RecB superfamily